MEKKTKRTSNAVASKMCIRCGKILPLSEFYMNKGWRQQNYRDAWCRDCVEKHCHDKESLKEYCYDNNRKWDDSFYDTSLKKAQYTLATNADYINPKTPQEKKDEIEGRAACRQFFTLMNMKFFYGYIENDHNGVIYMRQKTDQSNPSKGKAGENKDDKSEGTGKSSPSLTSGSLEYSRKWRGHFTKEQIDALEDIYAQYEEDFVLDNVNIRDYAKKVAKASLNADIAEDRMRRGEITAGEYKEAQKIFDDLSKSSNFAACKRKPGDTAGLGSLGEIIMRIEATGEINTEGFNWPKDSVDMVLSEYKHSLVAAGIEGMI